MGGRAGMESQAVEPLRNIYPTTKGLILILVSALSSDAMLCNKPCQLALRAVEGFGNADVEKVAIDFIRRRAEPL